MTTPQVSPGGRPMTPPTRTISELAAHIANRPRSEGGGADPLASAADSSGDGAASTEEIAALLTRFDSDGDGSLAHAEFRTMAEQLGLPKPPQGGPRGMRGAPGPIEVASLGQHLLSRLDADGNGTIDLASEGGHGPDRGQRLRSADADGDGMVTTSELLAQLSSFDKDQDGVISVTEHEALRPARTGEQTPPSQ